LNAPVSLPSEDPDAELLGIFHQELDTAAIAESRDQPIYRSLLKLSELIGGEYGDRVLYELLQNAHDAQPASGGGQVAISLSVTAPEVGELLVANGGHGFTKANLRAVRNIANSTKSVGEGIGNKGVGFRSVEALTDDPHVYSCRGQAGARDRFDGYCFRFARPEEVRAEVADTKNKRYADAIAAAMPKYLAAVPVGEQPLEVRDFAKRGFATVVRLPLRSAESVKLAIAQVVELLTADAPVLLFLDRLASLEVEADGVPELKQRVRLTREAQPLDVGSTDKTQTAAIVALGPDKRRWLLLRRVLPKEGVLNAVERSVALEAGLKSWREWRGDAVVSVAVPWVGSGLKRGRLYNFLPMDAGAVSPCFGHIDAPFFTNISRRKARDDLPLNIYLLDVAAELCAAAAVSLTSISEVPTRAVVDLVAWKSQHQRRLSKAFEACGTTLAAAAVWPTSSGRWASLKVVRAWPQASTKVFTVGLATRAGVDDILSPRLGEDRIAAFQELGRAAFLSTDPSSDRLAEWAEKVAAHLPSPERAAEKWGQLYSDLTLVLEGALGELVERRILPDRDGTLRPAGSEVYVRHDGGRRRKERSPSPPPALTRKLVMLSDHVSPTAETLDAFEDAGLWHRYDATEILQRLPSLFGEKPAPARRMAALIWAFEVWRHDAVGARRALDDADLHVPARSGWIPAHHAAFGDGWTDSGRDLDAFLAEARQRSEACAEAAADLLVDPAEWPVSLDGNMADWIRFLTDAGVSDCLVPQAEVTPAGPFDGADWRRQLRHALGQEWIDHSWHREPSHPRTEYWRVGEAWTLPGQDVVSELSEEARRRFAALAVHFLQLHGKAHLQFQIARTDRSDGHRDARNLFTPLRQFLATAEWFPLEGALGVEFVQCQRAWLVLDRRTEPRFVPRAPDDLAHILSRSDVALDILVKDFGLRRWRDRATAPSRLSALADVCEIVAQPERPQLRRHYDQAWEDLLTASMAMDPQTPLVVERTGGFGRLEPREEMQRVYLRDERSADIAKLLADSGQPVLAIGPEARWTEIAAAINSAGVFEAVPAGVADIRLLVDGEPFAPSGEDRLLVDSIPWLQEALVLGHELGARNIEKGAHVSNVLERLRSIRLRRVASIELQAGGGPARRLGQYLYRADRSATLIVEDQFDAETLETCATLLTNYVHQNLRTFELLLVKLSHRFPAGLDLGAVRPADANYADALQVDLLAVQEHLSAFRHDDDGKLELLVPLIAYVLGVETAVEISQQLSSLPRASWSAHLTGKLADTQIAAFMTAIDETEDLATLRRSLDLDYARFNRALIALGRPGLTGAEELRRLFSARLSELRMELLERLRRHFAPRFEDDAALSEYSKARDLDFIAFDGDWLETQETLSLATVQAHAEGIFANRFGSDPGGKLPALEALRSANRRSITECAGRARPILQAINVEQLHSSWTGGEKEVVDVLDRGGYLDFQALKSDHVILPLLKRAGLWPDGVDLTLDLTAHKLSIEDLEREKLLAEKRQAEESRRRNRVEFAGKEFDSAADDFAARFAAEAHAAFLASDWRKRSKLKLADLAIQPEQEPGSKGPGGRGPSKPAPKPPEPVRVALGLAGELLAFRYLEAKHRKHFSEVCWVSENRTSLFANSGDISKGFDFCVNTSEREWLYEVKATPNDGVEFELSDNEYRVAAAASGVKSRTYRVLFVQFALDPTRCRILELPNPAAIDTRSRFKIVGRSSLRMRFEPS
jgi:hypothetical protein